MINRNCIENGKFTLSDYYLSIIAHDAARVYDIKDYRGKGIVIDPISVAAKIEKSMNDILFNKGKNTHILQNGNGKIDDSVLCQAIFPVITCPCHCVGCYAVNDCTKEFNGTGKNTAEAWYKWYFISYYFPAVYYFKLIGN